MHEFYVRVNVICFIRFITILTIHHFGLHVHLAIMNCYITFDFTHIIANVTLKQFIAVLFQFMSVKNLVTFEISSTIVTRESFVFFFFWNMTFLVSSKRTPIIK